MDRQGSELGTDSITAINLFWGQNIKTEIKIPVSINFIKFSRVHTEIGTLSLGIYRGEDHKDY